MSHGSPRPSRRGHAATGFGAVIAAMTLLAACASPPPRVPTQKRPVEERRAVDIIRKAASQEGAVPVESRDITLPSGRPFRVDVAIDGKKYGIAYLTEADRATLGDHDVAKPKGTDLAVVQGTGPDAEAIILVLFADDYAYDDLAGEEHEATAITAEKKLARDVRDFLVQARAKRLP